MTREQIESILNDVGIKFRFEDNVSLSSIDAKSSEHQVRDELLLEDTIERYALQMQDGAEFPPAVLHPNGAGKMHLVDGFQRCAAHDLLDHESIGAYVVDASTPPLLLDIARVRLNDHGEPNTRKERLQHALWLINRHGVTQEQAATHCGVPQRAIQAACQGQRSRQILRGAGVSAREIDRLGSTKPQRISNMGTDAVIRKAVSLANDFDLSVTDVDKLAREVRSCRTERAKIAAVEEARSALEAQMPQKKATGRSVTPRQGQEFLRAASVIAACDPSKVVSSIGNTKALLARCKAVSKKVADIREAASA